MSQPFLNPLSTGCLRTFPSYSSKPSSTCFEKCVLKIQRIWRRHLEKHTLPAAIFRQAREYVDSAEKLETLPRASAGKSEVFLCKKPPVVFKKSEKEVSKERFNNMLDARSLCLKNKYTSLCVPKAQCYRSFVLEERLPITMDGTKEQMALYAENVSLFTEAVQQFTAFLCQSFLSDIAGGTSDPYAMLVPELKIGRYDNVCLYLTEDQEKSEKRGMIGLVDLESFSIATTRTRKKLIEDCLSSIRLFPYHFALIVEVVEQFLPEIRQESALLELERERATLFFQKVITEHKEFLKKKMITFETSTKLAPLSEEREAALLNVYTKCSLEGISSEQKKEAFALLLPETLEFLQECLNKKHEGFCLKKKEVLPEELLVIRTIEMDREEFPYAAFFPKTLHYLCQTMPFFFLGRKEILKEMLDLLLKEMEGDEISYFEPALGRKALFCCCIFC